MARVWRLIAHWQDGEKVVSWSKAQERIAIGWDPGDVMRFASPRDISEAVRVESNNQSNWPFSGQQLWDFSRVMAPGDLVILSTGGRRAAVMQVMDDYEYHAEMNLDAHGSRTWPYMLHQRRARPVQVNPDNLWKLSGGCAPGYNVRWTLIRCANDVDTAAALGL